MKISVGITTYNKPTYLRQCLQDVLQQTYRPSHIVVIDNSPNNQTTHMIHADFPEVTYRHYAENIGSAGGYHEALKIAASDSDFVWILDDDIRSGNTSLEELVAYIPRLEAQSQLGVIRGGCGRTPGDIVALQSFAWRGVLIKSEVIRHVGLPDTRFFLYACDVEYALRITQAGYRMYGVFAGTLREITPTKVAAVNFMGLKMSYYAEDFRLYYAHRNMLYTHMAYRKYGKALRLLVYGLRGMLMFAVQRNMRNVRAIAAGLYDGMRGRLGKNAKYLPRRH